LLRNHCSNRPGIPAATFPDAPSFRQEMMRVRQKAGSRRQPVQAYWHSLMNGSLSETERIMTTLTKTLLAVSVTGFVAGGVIDFGGFNLNPLWTVVLPLGAVCFGLSLISFMLEKEMAGFDGEEAKKLQWIQRNTAPPAPQPKPAGRPAIIQLKERTL
jgi:hypothetical protein